MYECLCYGRRGNRHHWLVLWSNSHSFIQVIIEWWQSGYQVRNGFLDGWPSHVADPWLFTDFEDICRKSAQLHNFHILVCVTVASGLFYPQISLKTCCLRPSRWLFLSKRGSFVTWEVVFMWKGERCGVFGGEVVCVVEGGVCVIRGGDFCGEVVLLLRGGAFCWELVRVPTRMCIHAQWAEHCAWSKQHETAI